MLEVPQKVLLERAWPFFGAAMAKELAVFQRAPVLTMAQVTRPHEKQDAERRQLKEPRGSIRFVHNTFACVQHILLSTLTTTCSFHNTPRALFQDPGGTIGGGYSKFVFIYSKAGLADKKNVQPTSPASCRIRTVALSPMAGAA